ncbi:MAG: RluA family pseudouridine synthase [Flavobacteriales bacterium]|nr:RluA family pseudouridine synthase [Flavobacteriales bacterium]
MNRTDSWKKLDVLYEDNHLIVVNKRAGDIVQGDRTGDLSLLDLAKAYVKHKYNKPGDVFLGLVHRIDRPVSGVVVFARTSKALARMNELFKNYKVEKTYWAVVKNRPEMEEAVLVNSLRKNEKQNKSYVCKEGASGSKSCELFYRLCGVTDNYWMLEVKPKTGRHHQIRAQLSHIGSPIKGDLKYGASRSNRDGGIHLHARSIKFVHPVKKIDLYIEAKVPKESLWSEFQAQMVNAME